MIKLVYMRNYAIWMPGSSSVSFERIWRITSKRRQFIRILRLLGQALANRGPGDAKACGSLHSPHACFLPWSRSDTALRALIRAPNWRLFLLASCYEDKRSPHQLLAPLPFGEARSSVQPGGSSDGLFPLHDGGTSRF